MALYAFDGTWNSAKDSEDPQHENTNVFRFYQAYHKRSNTDDFYVPGVGTRFDVIGKVLGGVFGLGELPRINDAYDHACKAWAGGDTIIDVVGFSRGAATTLDFCHCIQERGIRRPGSSEIVEPNPKIRFLGVWDIVAAFGLANLGNTALNIGHHLSLPKSSLQYCFHAMALDERRPSFLPTRLPGAYEVWFRGVHSDVGGGNGNVGLNDVALKWMLSKAKAAALPIAGEDIAALHPDPAGIPHPDKKLPLSVRLIGAVDRRHYDVSPLDGWTNPPATCPVESVTDEQAATEVGPQGIEVLPLEVRRRIAALWETADAVATANGYTLDHVRDSLLTFFQPRVPQQTNEDQYTHAPGSEQRLLNTMIDGARARGFRVLTDFFFTEALFKLPRLFPLTD
ncbi:MAG: phospholipase effector Tle1 domain-containing protein [Vicinamibacterales bacterium]